MLRLIYGALWFFIAPIALARLWWRGRFEPGYRLHVKEHFGFYATLPWEGRPIIWVHAVSVGETRAAQPLIEMLLSRYPDHALLLTHMTPTGRATGYQLFGERVIRCYLPYDMAGAVKRFLNYYKPRLGVLLETEVWPNLIHICKQLAIPLVLANARMSDRSFKRALTFGHAVVSVFSGFSGVLAQSNADAQRLRMLGAVNVHMLGNLKFDLAPSMALQAVGRQWRSRFSQRPVWLAASTRDGEEMLLLQARRELMSNGGKAARALLILVPRHPQRFDAVISLMKKSGLRVMRRSEWGDGEDQLPLDVDVLFGDSMGEMTAYFTASDIAFIGGSLRPFGGQNLIEACAVGTPVLFGPHMFNFAQVSEDALDAGAAWRVSDNNPTELGTAMAALLCSDQKRAIMSAAALSFAREHRGATERTVHILDHWLG
ncbi:lipid IV(A) 3-deoxy-D-manno-octulosonic acid transferase [Candidatus Pandoraea novymonadis]|uniref:lipid IV(A) 3-deoxy-D-manno-octulosonic acid transferase n=1 Tax=Candidatus Pandoraea novymonadis TaxID=1808959 RepID=UPI000D080C9F|nr:lipid IV(A) 3-deoxy-D-manno-octulosonic acid transferase [Candidatus Pandoraea novymonadis]